MKYFRKRILILVLVALVFYVFYGRSVIGDFSGTGGDKTGIYIEVASGETLREITNKLVEHGIVKHDKLFYQYAKGKSSGFQYGGHVFSTDMSFDEICDQLCQFGIAQKTKVVIPEGYELRLIADACENAGLCSADDFMNALRDNYNYDFIKDKKGVNYRLEGFLFPATYEFNYGTSAHDIIDTMLKTFDSVYTDEYSKRAKELGMTDYEVVTLASVIEREAANMAEHKKVSGVFYNRIKDGMKLQSCATVQYILKERKDVLSVADTKIDSPYNTYMYEGLPVGPVASPGKSAIEAALYPEKHGYYYFVAKSDGSGHVFSKTFAEHDKAASQNQ